jgi:hypothetical protein
MVPVAATVPLQLSACRITVNITEVAQFVKSIVSIF